MTPNIRRFFATMSRISPQIAGRMALQLFSTPLPTGRLSPSERRLEDRAKKRLSTAERLTVRSGKKTIIGYRLGQKRGADGRTVLLVHGWMSGARFMLAIADDLVRHGDEVICFDLPAHGESSGRTTNLVDCAKALAAIAGSVGPVNIILAHSFGGAVTAFALTQLGVKLTGEDARVILMASPNQLSVVTQRFSAAIGLSDRARAVYEERLCLPLGGDIQAMDGNALYGAAGVTLRIIHSSDDAEVPVEQGRRFLDLGKQAAMIELGGLGHRRVLYADTALAALRDARTR
jgi:pimeloyl-ACP methyl ester carboxylesterase